MRKELKKRILDTKRKATGLAIGLTLIPARVMAGSNQGNTASTGVDQIDTMLTTFKTLFTGTVAAIGYIILVKNIAETAKSYQDRDSQGMWEGFKGIIGGGIMAGVGTLLSLIGIQ